MHRCGASSEVVLADPSAAVALLWLRRSVAFNLALFRHMQPSIKAFIKGTRDRTGKVQSGQRPSSAPVPPQGTPSGSGRLGTPRARPSHWAPRHRLERAASKTANSIAVDHRRRDDIDSLEAFRGAYTDELQPYHKWLLRQTFSISISHAPGYTDFALAIGPGLGDAERDQVIDGEISALLRAGEPLVRALRASYAQLQMDDVRRA